MNYFSINCWFLNAFQLIIYWKGNSKRKKIEKQFLPSILQLFFLVNILGIFYVFSSFFFLSDNVLWYDGTTFFLAFLFHVLLALYYGKGHTTALKYYTMPGGITFFFLFSMSLNLSAFLYCRSFFPFFYLTSWRWAISQAEFYQWYRLYWLSKPLWLIRIYLWRNKTPV